MNHALTAQDLFSEMRRMPATERAKFFLLLSTNAFRDDDFSHEQVFGHLAREPLSAAEAAEYLEISLPKIIPETIAALKGFGLARIGAGHCTGWRAMAALGQAFGDEVLAPSAVGKRYWF